MGVRRWCSVFEGCLMSALAAFTILKLASQAQMLRNSQVYPKQKLGYRFVQAQDSSCSESWCSVVDIACMQITTAKGKEDWGLVWKYGFGKR